MKELSCGFCPYIIKNDGIYIFLNKTSRCSLWNFFKGKIESGESFEECAEREFLEETGFDLSSYHKEKVFFQKNKRKNILIYLVEIDIEIEAKRSQEIYSSAWIRLDPKIIVSKNQSKIFSDIFIYFKPTLFKMKNSFFPVNFKKELV